MTRKIRRCVAVLGFPVVLIVASCVIPLSPLGAQGIGELVRLPEGFRIEIFADGLTERARFMAFDGGGNLYVTLAGSGRVAVLPDRDRNGRADTVIPFATGLSRPHGIDVRDGWVYVGETHRVVRLRDLDGDLKADVREKVVQGLPTGGHWTRTVRFGPEGKLYVSIGSSCNVCVEKDRRRAAIVRYEPDGLGEKIFAEGLRNSVGLAWRPETGEMWAVDNGRDWLGDNLPPEEINVVREGRHYGWPYCYGNRTPDAKYNRRAFCAQKTEPPAFEMQAHSAPLGLTFYTGAMFPPEYRGDLFIAFHGSWNRTVPTGYKVVRVRIRDGKPAGIEDFAAGWLAGFRVHGRPTDVIVGPDGALFVSDDKADRIYRISYGSR
ncbi:MAG: PQQ-dependent sugar dehydrogenase [Nitrospinota bacterium]